MGALPILSGTGFGGAREDQPLLLRSHYSYSFGAKAGIGVAYSRSKRDVSLKIYR